MAGLGGWIHGQSDISRHEREKLEKNGDYRKVNGPQINLASTRIIGQQNKQKRYSDDCSLLCLCRLLLTLMCQAETLFLKVKKERRRKKKKKPELLFECWHTQKKTVDVLDCWQCPNRVPEIGNSR